MLACMSALGLFTYTVSAFCAVAALKASNVAETSNANVIFGIWQIDFTNIIVGM